MGIKERKSREREMRRQQILVAAKRIFSQKGYEKATMEDIAREAELSAGTLYLYFKSKDELYASLCLRVLRFINVKVEHVINEAGPGYADKQQGLLDAMKEVYAFDPLILNNMFHLQSSETLRTLSPDLLDEINALSRKALQSMARLFQQGINSADIIDRNPLALADIIWALFSGIVLWEESKKIINPDRSDLDQSFEVAFDILGRGLQK